MRALTAPTPARCRDGVAGDERGVVLVDQRGRLVVAGAVGARDELRVGDVAEERREAVVHLRLGLGGQHARARGPGHAGLPLAVRDDVQGGDRRGGRRHNAEHDHGERERTSQDDSSSGHAGRGGPTMARHATTAPGPAGHLVNSVREFAHIPTVVGRTRRRRRPPPHATKPSSLARGARRDRRPDSGGGTGRRRQARAASARNASALRTPRVNWDGDQRRRSGPAPSSARRRYARHRLQGLRQRGQPDRYARALRQPGVPGLLGAEALRADGLERLRQPLLRARQLHPGHHQRLRRRLHRRRRDRVGQDRVLRSVRRAPGHRRRPGVAQTATAARCASA